METEKRKNWQEDVGIKECFPLFVCLFQSTKIAGNNTVITQGIDGDKGLSSGVHSGLSPVTSEQEQTAIVIKARRIYSHGRRKVDGQSRGEVLLLLFSQ